MSISRDEAQKALHDVERTQRRSATLRGYEAAAPFFFLWAGIWFVGYGAQDLGSRFLAQWAWPALALFGWAASLIIGLRRTAPSVAGAAALRWLLAFIAFAVFASGVIGVMQPASGDQIGAFIPMIVALTYALAGLLFNAMRFVGAGAAIAALTLGGYFYLPSHFMLWMAFVGAGALALAGLWMRRA
ncbi:MAG TPA: hypothetical protein VHC42_07710 [Rhizomicrobium sp.]|nr:hypothetical protein [Rhizomicrobium sp.]